MTPTEFAALVTALGGPTLAGRKIVALAGGGNPLTVRNQLSKRMHGDTKIGPIAAACVRAMIQTEE